MSMGYDEDDPRNTFYREAFAARRYAGHSDVTASKRRRGSLPNRLVKPTSDIKERN